MRGKKEECGPGSADRGSRVPTWWPRRAWALERLPMGLGQEERTKTGPRLGEGTVSWPEQESDGSGKCVRKWSLKDGGVFSSAALSRAAHVASLMDAAFSHVHQGGQVSSSSSSIPHFRGYCWVCAHLGPVQGPGELPEHFLGGNVLLWGLRPCAQGCKTITLLPLK